jgi:D-alanine-D-alanine ligase
MLSPSDLPFFLEINTLPGLTPTSLLPKSASCHDISFTVLAKELVLPAINRFNAVGFRSEAGSPSNG